MPLTLSLAAAAAAGSSVSLSPQMAALGGRRRLGEVGALLDVLGPVAHGLGLVEDQVAGTGHVVAHAALAQVVVFAVQYVTVECYLAVAVVTHHLVGCGGRRARESASEGSIAEAELHNKCPLFQGYTGLSFVLLSLIAPSAAAAWRQHEARLTIPMA